MRKSAVLYGVFILVCVRLAQDTPDVEKYVYPDPNMKISLIEAVEGRGRLLVGKSFSNSDLAGKIMAELGLPYHETVIKLNQCSRNIAGDADGPNVLFLSQNEGGFPRHGLSIEREGIITEYPKLNYVDLVLNEQRLDMGGLDIYSHELGHVMMMNIWPDFPKGKSTKQHVSMGITDYNTAFFEGWGIHFQRLGYDRVKKYSDEFHDSFSYSRATGGMWHSNLDKELRLNAVLQNKYIHQKLLPRLDTSEMGLEELILLEHTSPHFDGTRLKNAQQMLSCEGVLATLFYRINNNKKLQNGYKDKGFYERFLVSGLPDEVGGREIFSPFENVLLKNFWVWHELRGKLESEDVIAIEFIEQWGKSFPEDREEILKVFLLTTVGMTVATGLEDTYEEMAYSGMVGDIQAFRGLMPQFQESFTRILQGVLNGELALDANVGPQLWIKNMDLRLQTTLWNKDRKSPLMVNLNTASVFELASFRGVRLASAREIVEKREELGFFKDMDEAKQAGFRINK